MHRLLISICVLGGLATPAAAQTPQSTYADMQAGLAAAQSAATRPGDESLSCPALEDELVATAKQPALQAYVAKSGAAAQAKQAAANEALARTGSESALTLFSAVVPGGDWAALARAVAQAPAQQAQTTADVQQRMQQAQEMMAVMPYLMRGQHVIELAQARNCAWLQQGSPPK